MAAMLTRVRYSALIPLPYSRISEDHFPLWIQRPSEYSGHYVQLCLIAGGGYRGDIDKRYQ